VAAEVVAMMEEVVESGTGTRAAVPGYRVAGKTGTAWKTRPEGGYGSKGDRDYVASFAGFLPADDPRLVVLVVVDEPSQALYSGGRAAAPIFSEFAQFAVRRLRIPSESERAGLEQAGRVQAVTPAHQRLLDEAAFETAAASNGG
jgi:cell division protein FtsI (penicillin-binding protein 3)